MKIVQGEGYVQCPLEEATHVRLNFHGPVGILTIPMILRGTRDGTGCWSWNGDTEKPTIKPSLLTTGTDFKCHTWVSNGKAHFLDDTTHELKGQTIDLLDVP